MNLNNKTICMIRSIGSRSFINPRWPLILYHKCCIVYHIWGILFHICVILYYRWIFCRKIYCFHSGWKSFPLFSLSVVQIVTLHLLGKDYQYLQFFWGKIVKIFHIWDKNSMLFYNTYSCFLSFSDKSWDKTFQIMAFFPNFFLLKINL